MSFPVPFKTVVRHASASHRRAQNLIVQVVGADGRIGWGEGCPRQYVTGETIDSALEFIDQHADDWLVKITGAEPLRTWIKVHREEIDRNPAAFCAVELAVLDLLGKSQTRSLEDVLDVAKPVGEFRYTAVLSDLLWPAYRWQCGRYRRAGFVDFKVKLCGVVRRDQAKLRALENATSRSRASSSGVRIRVDANNLWESAEDCVKHLGALNTAVFAVEEPLRPGDFNGMLKVAEQCSTRIVVDESLLRAEHLDALSGDPANWIANVRVSKMGGVIRSLEVARKAVDLGVGVIVGCQVGETSILSRAALTVMQSIKPRLLGAEGAFGTHLLRQDLTSGSIMFGPCGVLAVEGLASSGGGGGLGLEIAERAKRDLVLLRSFP
ncbi:MAG: hypothetical protein KTU85_09980 [Acidimicrobiia bacterium]|nr:hypothetical protein [Acidimicrobiia bacterium]